MLNISQNKTSLLDMNKTTKVFVLFSLFQYILNRVSLRRGSGHFRF